MAPRKTTKSAAKTSNSAKPTAKAAKSTKASTSGNAAANTVQSGRVTRSMTSNNVATPNQPAKVTKQTPKARKPTKVSQAAKTAQSAKANSAVKAVKPGKAVAPSKAMKPAKDTKSGSSAKTPKTATSATASRFNNLFTMEHDAYVVKLKDSDSGTWKDIAGLFNERYPPANGHDERTSGGLQVRYSRNIKANIKKNKDFYKDALAKLDDDSNGASTANNSATTGQQSSANAPQAASNNKSSSSKQPARKKAKTSKGTANVTAEYQEIVDDDDDVAAPASAGQKKDVQKMSEKRKGKMPASLVSQQPDPAPQENVRRSGRVRKPVFRDGSELAAPKKTVGKKRKTDETVEDDNANAAAANVAPAAASKKAKSLKRKRDDTVEDEDVAASERALTAEMKKTRGRGRNYNETVDHEDSNTAPTSSRTLGVKTSYPSGTNAPRQIMPSYKQRRVANAEHNGPTVQDFAGLGEFHKDTPATDPRTGERVTTKRRRLHDGPSDVAAPTTAPTNETGIDWYENRVITSADNPNLQPTIPAAKPIQRLKSGNWPRAPPLRANANYLQDLADYDETKPNCGLK